MENLYGALEAGGTKIACVVGTGPNEIRDEVRFPTGDPERSLERIIAFFQDAIDRHGPLAAIGIGCFGPVDLNPQSATYGCVTQTPKEGWSNTDVVGPISSAFGVPIGFDTDVNAAALGEWRWGAARGLTSFLYVTVGTGIGGGGMARGRLLHGLVHPEVGHMRIPHDLEKDPFLGSCPFHADCWEGLAAGTAIAQRWGRPADQIPPDHPAWELESHYLSLGLANLVFSLSPERIILGGGVMEQVQMFPPIRKRLRKLLAGYVQALIEEDSFDDFIVPAALGNRAGVLGGIALAELAVG